MGSETGVDDKTQALRRDIARTQWEMGETIDEIQYRLSPRHIMNQTKESVRRTGVSTSHKLITKVKENPIPAAMIGVGLWLLTRSDSSDGRAAYEVDEREFAYFDYDNASSRTDRMKAKASDALDTAREKVSGVAEATKEKAADLSESTRESASHIADVAKRKAYRARQQSRDLLSDSPLVGGLVALALGAIIAAVIPETEKENELLGDARERVLDQAKDLAQGSIDKAKRVASAVTDTVKSEVRSASQTTSGVQNFR